MAQGEAKLLYPGLAGFYETVQPIAETFVGFAKGKQRLAASKR